MQAQKLLHTLLQKSSVIGHEKRLYSLLRAVDSVTHQGKLSLTSIGRHLPGKAKVKHKIKSINNLLGNEQLMDEREGIYALIATVLLTGRKQAIIIVDWSPCVSHEQHMLKASIMLQGRSMTLYEEVHPECNLGKLKIHKRFLQRLKRKIPKDCEVIVETDAGFRTEWFDLIVTMGWHFIGRIRSNMLFHYEGEEEWIPCSSLYAEATSKAKYLGKVLLGKKRSFASALYLYHDKKANKQGGKALKKKGKVSSWKMEKKYSRANREPWLLATSLPGSQKEANALINKYRYRMRIEHEFRDTKNGQWGIGLEESRTRDVERLQILLLIGHLALFVLWATGLAAEDKKLHSSYQANTIKRYRCLSLVYLGLQILRHDPESISELDIRTAFNKVLKSCYQ